MDIANSFSVAGVPDVVGSMWPVSSSVATEVASTLWGFLSDFFPEGEILEGESMARALQIAILNATTSHPGDPLMWAGFIHVRGMGSRSLSNVRSDANDEEDSKKQVMRVVRQKMKRGSKTAHPILHEELFIPNRPGTFFKVK